MLLVRTLANIGLSLLLVVTLLWGGCLSCPQYFMFPNSHGGCCHPDGHCKQVPSQQPASTECNIQPIAPTSGVSDTAIQPVLLSAIIPADRVSIHAIAPGTPRLEPGTLDPSPPDLYLLQSILRI